MAKMFGLLPAVLVILLGAACGAPPEQKPSSTPAPAASQVPIKGLPAWQTKWETTLAEGKKEGTVRIYTAWSPEARANLGRTFPANYDIQLEFVVGRGAELLPKLQAEQRAGLNLMDLVGLGTNSLLVSMKPLGLFTPIEPMLLLPEVLDPSIWPEGHVPFADNDRIAIPMTANAQRYLTYNKDLVKEGELTSYSDTLNPKYKGKIIIGDPGIAGAGNAFFSHLAHNVWNLEQTKDFFKRLLTEQGAAVSRDYRGQVEALAKGKYAIALGTQGSAVSDFILVGAPIANVPLKDVEVSHESGAISVAKNSPHPNATIIFVNWLLTQEGQTQYSQGSGTPVIRRGVPTEGINPIFLLNPGDKITLDTEEYIIYKGEMAKVAKELIDAYAK